MFDPVKLSDAAKHPIDHFAEYKDFISGFTGIVTGLGYQATGAVSVVLTRGSDTGEPQDHVFDLSTLATTDQNNRLEPEVRPDHPVEFYGEYRDKVSGYVGRVLGISYSSNKCIQVKLGSGDKDGKPISYTFDIQAIESTGEAKQHNLTSDTNPGAMRVNVL